MNTETNTSPILSLDEQQVKIKNTLTGPQPLGTHTEVSDNTLQPESPEKEDTGVQQVDPTNVQKQGVEENAKLAEIDASKQQVQVINVDSQAVEDQQEPDQQESEIPEDEIS